MTKQIIVVAGVFDNDGGRPSRFINSFVDNTNTVLINGGYYNQLVEITKSPINAEILCWFADVPNHLQKILPQLRSTNPNLLLVQSKNNSLKKYTDDDLHERMRKSSAELLIEFVKSDKNITSRLLSCDKSVNKIVNSLNEVIEILIKRIPAKFPIESENRIFADTDSNSHLFTKDVRVPVNGHVGAFATPRKFHIHEGVDIYADDGTPVYAMDYGTVIFKGPFTGPSAGHPHWNDTECILVQHTFGVINYGEIKVNRHLEPGDFILPGHFLGNIVPVLRVNKGRPMSMLHLERYISGTTSPIKEWPLNSECPIGLLDPTTLLLCAGNYD